MPQFTVDDDLAALVWQLAKPKPFENLSFSAALRRVLHESGGEELGPQHSKSLSELPSKTATTGAVGQKKTPTPSPMEWAATVPELKGIKSLNTWKAICDLLEVKTAGDSARRKLKNWVKLHHPIWPAVPDIE